MDLSDLLPHVATNACPPELGQKLLSGRSISEQVASDEGGGDIVQVGDSVAHYQGAISGEGKRLRPEVLSDLSCKGHGANNEGVGAGGWRLGRVGEEGR